jgi:Tfp pilus assembly protein PilO
MDCNSRLAVNIIIQEVKTLALKLKLSTLDKRQRFMLGFVGAIALVAGFYMLYYDPSQKKIAAIREEVEAKDKEIRTAKIQAALFKKLKKKVAELEKHLSILRTKTTTSGEVIPLIKIVEEEAQRLDMKVINMFTSVHEPPPPPPPKKKKGSGGKAPPPAQKPAYTKIILDINLQSKYKKLEEFLKTLQNLETFLVIEGLDISSDEKIYPRLTSNLVMNLYSKKGVDKSAIVK